MNRSTYLVFPVLLLLVTSCASLKLDPPGQGKQAILVLPVKVTNTSMTNRHLFYYVYEIAGADESMTPYKAVFKLPIKGDMLIIDTLPPGNYFVDKFTFLPSGSSADHSYGNNVQNRNDKFKLERGRITVFSKSLCVWMRNETPGRMGETVYGHDMITVSQSQKEEVLATLEMVPNFDKWQVLALEETSRKSNDLIENQEVIRKLNDQLPMMIDGESRLDIISVSPNSKEYDITMTAFGKQASNIEKIISLYGNDHLRVSICNNFSESEDWNKFVHGFPINVVFRDKTNKVLSEFKCD